MVFNALKIKRVNGSSVGFLMRKIYPTPILSQLDEMAMRALSLLILMAITGSFLGCAARTPYLQDFSLTDKNSGQITIYRTQTSYHSLNPEKPFVFVGDREVGTLAVGSSLTIRLPSGDHRFSIREPLMFQPVRESRSLMVTVKSGENYYLRYSNEAGGVIPLGGGAVFTSVTGLDLVPKELADARR